MASQTSVHVVDLCEKRTAPDGVSYTLEEFIQFYGGRWLEKWQACVGTQTTTDCMFIQSFPGYCAKWKVVSFPDGYRAHGEQ